MPHSDYATHYATVLRTLEDRLTRMAGILEGTGAGTWEWNVQTGECRFNDRWAEIIGYTLDELGETTIDTWRRFAHPADLELSRALLEEHFSGRSESYECEARMRHEDGHWVWIRDRGRVLTWTGDGKPEWMFGTHLDITEHKRQLEQLQRSEETLNRVSALAGLGGWEYDIPSGMFLWSPQCCHVHGVTPGYTPDLAEMLSLYAEKDRPIVADLVRRAIETGWDWDVEVQLVTPDRRKRWIRLVGHAWEEEGQVVRLHGAVQDITDRVVQRNALEAANERVALATDSGGIGVWDIDLETRFVHLDPWMHRHFGVEDRGRDEHMDHWMAQIHPQDRPRVMREMGAAFDGLRPMSLEFRVVQPSGQVRFLRVASRVTRDPEGVPKRMVGVAWDVTELREMAAQLSEQHELLRTTLRSIGDAVITTDPSGRVDWLNPVAARMTGWETLKARGRHLTEVFRVVEESSREPVAEALTTASAEPALDHDHTLISRNGREFGIEHSASPIEDKRGKLLGMVIVFRDVTERRRLTREMSHRATHDDLTGLVNRAEFETRLETSLRTARTDRAVHSLLVIDLDRFKVVNDTCGHTAGDRVLQEVSSILKDAVRGHDTVARTGGDEFAILLEHCTTEQAQRVAQGICDRMDQARFVFDDQRFRVGTSIGIAPVDDRWLEIGPAIQAADSACFAAKEEGRNRIHTWREADEATTARRGETQWATRLERALDENRFVLYAQRIDPVVPNGEGLFAEVLLRLRDPQGDIIGPGAFLPAAERFHMMSRIDRWVLRRTLETLKRHPGVGAVQTININVSGQSVGDRAFHRFALEQLDAAGPEICRRVCLEITESTAITAITDAARFVETVRAKGVRVALDDFGAGASSFGYLKSLQVDLLKVDGQFIRGLVDSPLDEAAVRCFIDVANVVGVKTVAEYVDRPEILDRIGELGIDYAQGFLLHKPEPLSNLLGIPCIQTITPTDKEMLALETA